MVSLRSDFIEGFRFQVSGVRFQHGRWSRASSLIKKETWPNQHSFDELIGRFVLVLVLVLEASEPLSIEYEDEYDDEHDLNTLFWR